MMLTMMSILMALTKIALSPTWLKRWAQKSFAQDFPFFTVHPPSPSSVSELKLMVCLKTQPEKTLCGIFHLSLFQWSITEKLQQTPDEKPSGMIPRFGLLLLCVFKLPRSCYRV